MSIIKKLPQSIISKVAAGEVIERPASVVKELIENSIDAYATQINIEIEDSGLKRIKVKDNGCGMDKKDLLESFKRYTTSKIYNLEDLNTIKSLGFRGEALYSISSISKTTIQSKTKSSNKGNLIQINFGKLVKNEVVGTSDGTITVVEDIFKNIPARKKFLKTPKTEFRHILEVIINNVLAFTNTGFSLRHNKRKIFDIHRSYSLDERIKSMLGNSLLDQVISIESKRNEFKLTGYISKPQFSNSYKNNEYIFVNNRPVKHKIIPSIIKQAYGNLLDSKTYPSFIIFVSLPPERIDVNVHPRKEEVIFFNTKEIYKFLEESVKNALEQRDLTFTKTLYNFNEKSYDYVADKLRENENLWSYKEKEDQEILQIGELYLITGNKNGLLLIDQHAAHEKILYDQFIKNFENKIKLVDSLEDPQVIHLSITQAEALEEFLYFFKNLGFDIENFGGNSFKINAAPIIFHKLDLENIILETLKDLVEEKTPAKVNNVSKKLISYLACRTAVKAKEYLTQSERKRLVEKVLESKPHTYTCPHGRPVMVEISLRELDRMFRRR